MGWNWELGAGGKGWGWEWGVDGGIGGGGLGVELRGRLGHAGDMRGTCRRHAPCQNRVLELEQLETDWPVSFQLPLTRLEERNARCKQETRPPASQVGGGAGRCFGQVCGFLNACVVILWRQWGLFCMHVVCSFAVVIAPMAPEGRQIGP